MELADASCIHAILRTLSASDILTLLCVNRKIAEYVHSSPTIPYLPRTFLVYFLLQHTFPKPSIQMDFKNSLTPPKAASVTYRHNTTAPPIPPIMPLRSFIVSLNIPVHQKFMIDLTTFPVLKRLVLTFFAEPQTFQPLNLAILSIYLQSQKQIPFLNKLRNVVAKTFIHIHCPSALDVAEINNIFHGAVIITEKLSDFSLAAKVKCLHNSIPINRKVYEVCSVPASLAFLHGNFVTQRLIEKAYVYGRMVSMPISPLSFKQLFLINLNLPKRGNITLRNVETLVVGSCDNLAGFDGLDKCPIKSFTFCKNSAMTSIKVPTTLTYLDASEWKPLTIPPLPLLRALFLKKCNTFRHITVPPGVVSLTVEECQKLKRIANLAEISLTSIELVELPVLVVTNLPTSLRKLTLNNLSTLEISLNNLNLLEEFRFAVCSNLRSIECGTNLKKVEIDCCVELSEFVCPCTLNSLSITMCSSISSIEANARNVQLSNLGGLYKLHTTALDKMVLCGLNVTPSFEDKVYQLVSLRRVTLDKIPKAKKLILDAVSIENTHIDFGVECQTIRVKNMRSLKAIKLPNTLVDFTGMSCGFSQIEIPSELTRIHLKDLPITSLKLPPSCVKLKLQKCKKLQELELPTTLTFLIMKKVPRGLLKNAFLPNVPFEVLRNYCLSDD
ncbi:hypothetical protein EIN_252150 [Entamoeba invadens IP1]|uniref:Uncharacterized protein n=1 Tax=Entamoeba invadens IP1 TaxID=370355 RepID=A0A0A1UEL3_ENTIV|nr:hypothetical protein EIN_252150 [Entamoeba invadens IP1]ELP95011.1 hypothetical protein EIN_252150 [Entamoeba invadens IP1]|eukprot:XP_004261782.1 hypothetical protein EIN_252150 [Entamoeba invadens IP1]